jgi:hypothetical protein
MDLDLDAGRHLCRDARCRVRDVVLELGVADGSDPSM